MRKPKVHNFIVNEDQYKFCIARGLSGSGPHRDTRDRRKVFHHFGTYYIIRSTEAENDAWFADFTGFH